MFAAVWSLGINLEQDLREKFDFLFKDIFKTYSWQNVESVFDLSMDQRYTAFSNWDFLPTDFTYQKDLSFYLQYVQTTETARIQHFLKLLIKHQTMALLLGPNGSGKTVLIQNLLQKCANSEYLVTNIAS